MLFQTLWWYTDCSFVILLWLKMPVLKKNCSSHQITSLPDESLPSICSKYHRQNSFQLSLSPGCTLHYMKLIWIKTILYQDRLCVRFESTISFWISSRKHEVVAFYISKCHFFLSCFVCYEERILILIEFAFERGNIPKNGCFFSGYFRSTNL